ncbi:unnamed protein product [Prorocentrum cordatum]|uniref:Lipoxygenase domain-containing protein n=1 Tax=Prorocentrum cordatum TaxID=2364126 RepID=A0ABN9S314_9DINO|nr:unnamed protein product [Polarella glacialis]
MGCGASAGKQSPAADEPGKKGAGAASAVAAASAGKGASAGAASVSVDAGKVASAASEVAATDAGEGASVGSASADAGKGAGAASGSANAGKGASTASRAAAADAGCQEPTSEQLRCLVDEIGVIIRRDDKTKEAPSDEIGGGKWWWGHSTGSGQPLGCPFALAAATALLPPYHRDMIRWKSCPAYADHMAHEQGGRGPFCGGTVYQTHEDCERMLREHVAEWESGGRVERKNELGFLVLDDGIFPEPHRCLGLGYPVDVHSICRRFVGELIHRIPGRGALMKEVHRFMHGRNRIEFPQDVDVWWTRMLWTYVVGNDVDVPFVRKFLGMRDSWLMGSVASAGQISLHDLTFRTDDILRDQKIYRDRIEQNLPNEVPQEHRLLVAQGVLEMICFAGGLSVPSTITSAVACMYSGIMPEPVTLGNVEAFVFEVTRLFPAVHGFPWHKDGHRHILHLSATLRDPKAWGPDSDKFTLKDVGLYREKHLGFADSARSAKDDTNSRNCPGTRQALDVCQAFVIVLSSWTYRHCAAPKQAWRCPEKIQPAVKPNYFEAFTLERDGVNLGDNLLLYEQLSDGNQTGEILFVDFTPEDFQSFIDTVDADGDGVPDAITAMSLFTRIFYRASKAVWESQYHITEIEVPKRPAATLTEKDSMLLPVGGIRMPKDDEQWGGMPVLQMLGQRALIFLNSMSSDAVKESLLVKDEESRRQAIYLARQAYLMPQGGSFLPKQKDKWEEFSSDRAQGLLALYSWGQLDLRCNKDPEFEGLGEFVVDPFSKLLGSIPVRDTEQFERLGAAAFFDRGEGSGELRITAINWCHAGRVVKPGDDDWEHAKYAWRCTMGLKVTAVDHLVATHWIVSNAFSTSMRESFRANHPIRRLLHVNMYDTASINYTSFWTLYPENGFLHHMTPWKHEGLVGAFDAAFSSFRYRTWPQTYEESDLPEDLKATMPMFEDGLAVWRMFREWHAAYINLYYEGDLEVLADPEIQQYWTFRCSPQYKKGLPPLSKDALIDQVTHTVFWTCAFHEFVGSAVEFCTDPSGLFFQVRPGQNMADMQHMMQAVDGFHMSTFRGKE